MCATRKPKCSPGWFSWCLCSVLQGVVEFSLCLLFAKLVSYTFLYWLPLYISNVGKYSHTHALKPTHTHNISAILVININPHHLLQLILMRERQETFQHCLMWEASWVSIKLGSQSFTSSLCLKLK